MKNERKQNISGESWHEIRTEDCEARMNIVEYFKEKYYCTRFSIVKNITYHQPFVKLRFAVSNGREYDKEIFGMKTKIYKIEL